MKKIVILLFCLSFLLSGCQTTDNKNETKPEDFAIGVIRTISSRDSSDKKLAQSGTTVFLTTQYLEEAEYLADHIAILHNGRILVQGTPQYLKEILPQRGVQLTFQKESAAEEAIRILQNHDIPIDDIKLNLPSLEEVFLTLIDEKEGC